MKLKYGSKAYTQEAKRREARDKKLKAASRKKFLAQIRYYKAGIVTARLLLKDIYTK